MGRLLLGVKVRLPATLRRMVGEEIGSDDISGISSNLLDWSAENDDRILGNPLDSAPLREGEERGEGPWGGERSPRPASKAIAADAAPA